MNKKEYDAGYQAAIEAIKKALQGNQQGNGQSGNGGLDSDMQQPPVNGQDGQGGGQDGQSGNSQKGKSQQSTRDGQSSASDNHGVVRPEDCEGPSGIGDTPSTPGGMVDGSICDKIAEEEGYEKYGAGDDAVEREWKEVVLKNVDKMPGKNAGAWKSKLEGLYKVNTDWKKALKQVIGKSISPEDKRSAFANKNVLVSQDRISRTDKDKYDNVDYIMAFIDSSGSMSDEQLKLVLSEVYSVAQQKKPLKLVVVQCDTRIQEIKEYSELRQLKNDMIHATVKGRGGTELKPCWDLLLNDPKFKRSSPELVMVFTDGYLTQYKRGKTMQNLCWCVLDNPSFNVQYKDNRTKCIHLSTSDIR